MNKPIPVYAVNLAARTERRASVCEQFAGREEFDLHVVNGIEHRNGARGLWQTFYGIVEREAAKQTEYFIFCEDDHVFTADYSPELLMRCIAEADVLAADLLSGGMSVVRNPVEVKPGLFWVSWFNGIQFSVIFRRCYRKILAAKTTEGYAVDIQLSYLAKRKYVIYPYISEQREFGYSDATSMNEEAGRVTGFFKKAQTLLGKLQKVRTHYASLPREVAEAIMCTDVSHVFVPTYIINLPERTDRLEHIHSQFKNRPEFELHIVEAIRHDIGAVGLWQTICRIITEAKEADEDFVLLCEDDHFFTEHYDREAFLHHIMLGGAMGAELLNGGVDNFSNLVPLGYGLSWVDRFWSTQFIVIYKSAFDTIISAPFGMKDAADNKLSAILTSKLLFTPYISEQVYFGYSDIGESALISAIALRYFDNSRRELTHYSLATTPATSYPKSIEPDEYLSIPGLKALQMGCGNNLLQGWLNTDICPTYGATFMDVTQSFPLPDGSLDYIFAEHLIEGFDVLTVKAILERCFNLLRPHGVIRLTFYTADVLKKLDNSGEINKFIHRFSDVYLHTGREITEMLTSVGFSKPQIMNRDESLREELRGVNNHKIYDTIEQYGRETITIEAEKPR